MASKLSITPGQITAEQLELLEERSFQLNALITEHLALNLLFTNLSMMLVQDMDEMEDVFRDATITAMAVQYIVPSGEPEIVRGVTLGELVAYVDESTGKHYPVSGASDHRNILLPTMNYEMGFIWLNGEQYADDDGSQGTLFPVERVLSYLDQLQAGKLDLEKLFRD